MHIVDYVAVEFLLSSLEYRKRYASGKFDTSLIFCRYICNEFHLILNMQPTSKITSFQRNLRQIKPFIMLVVVVLTVSAATCSCSNDNKKIKITDAPSALKAHREFLAKASQTKETDTQKLIALTKEWFVLSDTLSNHIQPDSVAHPIYGQRTFSNLQDSIAIRLENIVDAETRSFEDILAVREALGEEPTDSLFKSVNADARKFFESLDMAQVPEMTKEEAISNYTTLLKSHLKEGIKSKSDMQRFIRAEDIAFRGFLVHLHELGNVSLKNITNSTESVCELIFKSATKGQMSKETPIIYMVMRTNRRIVQNAMTCLADIQAGRVNGKSEQAVVYLWMMMKPFFPTDDLSLSLLSNKQKKNMYTLAHELPSASAKLNKGMGWSPLPIEGMPNEIIKEYVCRR